MGAPNIGGLGGVLEKMLGRTLQDQAAFLNKQNMDRDAAFQQYQSRVPYGQTLAEQGYDSAKNPENFDPTRMSQLDAEALAAKKSLPYQANTFLSAGRTINPATGKQYIPDSLLVPTHAGVLANDPAAIDRMNSITGMVLDLEKGYITSTQKMLEAGRPQPNAAGAPQPSADVASAEVSKEGIARGQEATKLQTTAMQEETKLVLGGTGGSADGGKAAQETQQKNLATWNKIKETLPDKMNAIITGKDADTNPLSPELRKQKFDNVRASVLATAPTADEAFQVYPFAVTGPVLQEGKFGGTYTVQQESVQSGLENAFRALIPDDAHREEFLNNVNKGGKDGWATAFNAAETDKSGKFGDPDEMRRLHQQIYDVIQHFRQKQAADDASTGKAAPGKAAPEQPAKKPKAAAANKVDMPSEATRASVTSPMDLSKLTTTMTLGDAISELHKLATTMTLGTNSKKP